MKNLTLTGIILLAISILLFYLTSPNFNLNDLQISHIMGIMAGVGIGLIIGGMIGYVSKGSAIKEEQRKKEYKQLQKEKAELELKAQQIAQRERELDQEKNNESVSQLRRIFFWLLLRVFVYLYLIIRQLFMNFKHYNQNQLVLFPYSFEDLIPENHPVRIVNDILEKVNIDPLLKAYSKEGNPSYHPVMMLKVMVFAYMNNIYSSRKIEKALRENINFMWLSNMSIVDHNTVNRFRTHKLEAAFKNIFSQVVLLLAEEGLVSLKQVFVDGTKIEAQAGRYTFVWANAIKTNKEKMLRQLEELWKYAQSVAKEEDKDPEPPEFKEISKEKIRQTAENINAKLKGSGGKTDSDKKAKAKLNYIKKNFEKNLDKYEAQEAILAERNSYSKTDEDATFMRMKPKVREFH